MGKKKRTVELIFSLVCVFMPSSATFILGFLTAAPARRKEVGIKQFRNEANVNTYISLRSSKEENQGDRWRQLPEYKITTWKKKKERSTRVQFKGALLLCFFTSLRRIRLNVPVNQKERTRSSLVRGA